MRGGAKGSAPVQDSERAPTGEESLGGVAGADVADGGCGGRRQAGDGAPDGGWAAADPGMDAGDATRSNVSMPRKSSGDGV